MTEYTCLVNGGSEWATTSGRQVLVPTRICGKVFKTPRGVNVHQKRSHGYVFTTMQIRTQTAKPEGEE